MNAVSPRPATPEDLPQILKIEALSFPQPWSESNFVAEMNKPYSNFIVLTDDETDSVVVGYIVYWAQGEGASLLTLAVDPKWRGFGFGQKLLHLMLNDIVKQEIPKITLEVRKSNEGAIRMYEKVGFKTLHVRPGFYQDGEDALIMELKTSNAPAFLQ